MTRPEDAVSLRAITDANQSEIEALSVTPQQERFVAGVTQSLIEAAATPDAKPWYRAIYAGETPVGFVMISDNIAPGHPEYLGPYFLWRLLIDARWQRRGYGRAALDLIVQYLATRPDCDRLLSSYVPGDGSPLGFSLQYGFVPTGAVFDDEPVLELPLPRTFPGVAVCDDVRPADWLRASLRPWSARGIEHVATLVPDTYPAYGRILHRAPPEPSGEPERGSLLPDECAAVADVLARRTTTPDGCWFCMWEGYGTAWIVLNHLSETAPRVALEHRNCVLFHGPISAATAFRAGPFFQSPIVWWPDDRAWCVASELDIHSTYVAAQPAALRALIDHPALEVLECTAEEDIAHGA
jgi:diamine N-acetyltransferase